MGIFTQVHQPVEHTPVTLIQVQPFTDPVGQARPAPISRKVAVRIPPTTMAVTRGTKVVILRRVDGVYNAWQSDLPRACLGPIIETQQQAIATVCQIRLMGLSGIVIGNTGDNLAIVRLTLEDGA